MSGIATLAGIYPSNLMKRIKIRKDDMEEQTGFMGMSGKIWGVIGVLSLAFGILVICALVAMMFGMDVGGVF